MGRVVEVLAEKKRARDEREAVLGALVDSESEDEEEVKAVDKEGVTAADKSEAPESRKQGTARSSSSLQGRQRQFKNHRLANGISTLVQKNDTIVEEDSGEDDDSQAAKPRQREIEESGHSLTALGGSVRKPEPEKSSFAPQTKGEDGDRARHGQNSKLSGSSSSSSGKGSGDSAENTAVGMGSA